MKIKSGLFRLQLLHLRLVVYFAAFYCNELSLPFTSVLSLGRIETAKTAFSLIFQLVMPSHWPLRRGQGY
jgi:hypothetical protein